MSFGDDTLSPLSADEIELRRLRDELTVERIADRVHLFFNMNWERFESGDRDLFNRQLRDAIREELAPK